MKAGSLRQQRDTSVSTSWESIDQVKFKVNSIVRISACGPKGVTEVGQRCHKNFAKNTGFQLPYNQNIVIRNCKY